MFTTASSHQPVAGAGANSKHFHQLPKCMNVDIINVYTVWLSILLYQIEFPRFDGSNPKMWITNCETFFAIYDTEPHKWVRFATMHLSSSAALWFQTMQAQNPSYVIVLFCSSRVHQI